MSTDTAKIGLIAIQIIDQLLTSLLVLGCMGDTQFHFRMRSESNICKKNNCCRSNENGLPFGYKVRSWKFPWQIEIKSGSLYIDCERSLLSAGLDFRACERKGGTATADNTSRNEIRVAHKTQNSHCSKSIRLSIKYDT
jgi:hypothetical protein